ncbi:MAG: hypothetical protein KAH11_02315 [Rhodospirillales bacterium]|nr:hypothetical protein [Rhodospirillales bacterium]
MEDQAVKRLCLAVAVFSLIGLSSPGHVMAAGTDQSQSPSSSSYEPQDYSSPFGDGSCSKPAPTS